MNFRYIIDNREIYIKEYFETNKDGYPSIEYENLNLGDIIIYFKETPIFIIERKTLPDLLASIKDGRYIEQKKRLKDSNIKHKIYLIENDKNYSKCLTQIEKRTISSSLLSIIVQDINVIKTRNLVDTIKFLESLYNKLFTKENNTIKDCLLGTYDDSNKQIISCKKKSTCPKMCFKNQLCQIPGISTVAANIILDKYKSMGKFINAINTNEDIYKKIEFLEKLSITGKNNKINKLGKKKAEKIIEYLFN